MEENLQDYTILPNDIKLIIIGQSKYKRLPRYDISKLDHKDFQPREYFGRFRGDSDRRPYLLFFPHDGVQFYFHYGKGIRNYHYLNILVLNDQHADIIPRITKKGNWEIEIYDSRFRSNYSTLKNIFDLKNVQLRILITCSTLKLDVYPSNSWGMLVYGNLWKMHGIYDEFIREIRIVLNDKNIDDVINWLQNFKKLKSIWLLAPDYDKYTDKITSRLSLKCVRIEVDIQRFVRFAVK